MSKIRPLFDSDSKRFDRSTSFLSGPESKARKRKKTMFKILNGKSEQALEQSKFNELMVYDFTLGFEESEACFTELCTKASSIVNAAHAEIFLKDDSEHNVFTFFRDKDGKEVRVTKPLDRGMTGFIVSDATGVQLDDVHSSKEWRPELDEVAGFITKSYLACPIWDGGSGECIGVVEFRNKDEGMSSFSLADFQIASIFASRVGNAVTQSRQKSLLDGRNEAFAHAYADKFDSTEAICIAGAFDTDGTLTPIQQSEQRNAFTTSPKPFSNSLSSSNLLMLSERGWDYDVFVHSEEELTMHAVDIFDERGLFSRFSIPMSTFLNFVNEVKKGYSKVTPYHNYYHAFDVMHVCYLLMTKCRADEYLESFNTLSILISSLAHDLGHDGYNNDFHNTIQSELAITYNSVSVLENYSAAYLFRILRKKECNILSRLNQKDNGKIRSRLIDMILDTDAKNHYTLMTRFKHGLEMKQLSRGLLSSMLLHVSDVSNPARPGNVARKWAYAVQEEFFRQGDKEKKLKLPQSPFMDRSYENLPRMQEAFIDAVVTPVLTLLSEFLPLVKGHCLKPLLVNRAFWHNMLNQDLVKTSDIISHLNSRQQANRSSDVVDKDEVNHIEFENETPSSTIASDKPIPGIPASAAISRDQTVRKLSLVSFTSSFGDEELGAIISPKALRLSIRSPRRSFKDAKKMYAPKVKSFFTKILESPIFQILMLIATVLALFASDLNLALGDKKHDLYVDIGLLIVLTLFLFELFVSIGCVSKYLIFFFWLDLAASISLLLEINFIMALGDQDNFNTSESLGLARASRAAKAGARAGRLVKIIRLMKLVKIAKLAKFMFSLEKRRKKAKNKEESYNQDVDLKMSVVGRKMTESITKRVIIAVILMLLVFTLLDYGDIPDARQFQIDALADYPESNVLRQVFLEGHENIIKLQGVAENFSDELRLQELRVEEKQSFTAVSNPLVFAVFDIKDETKVAAWYSIGMTITVSFLLGILSLLFSQDAYRIMIRPIEKMKYTVQQLSENPLLHLEKMKRGSFSDNNETDILQQAITKMATLLQIGFGCAGAEIIAKSFSVMGELDPMVPGVRVDAIFGFCDIREFTFATEGLQQDVMLFVNKIAEILHEKVVECNGAPNKNIGDAFLIVWKLNTFKNGERSSLQKDLFDSALLSFQKTICEIESLGNLAAFIKEETDTSAAWKSTLEDFEVKMGFGLHTGWAIEGSIGSKVKVDASYLSPHVNLASRLENVTKLYGVPLLLSEDFVAGLSGKMQSTCRRCDRVTFKGSKEPMHIFHQDITPFHQLSSKPENYAELLEVTSWKEEAELTNVGIDIIAVKASLSSSKNIRVREIYEQAFNAYLDGNWKISKYLWHLWMEKFPGDTITNVLVSYLYEHNFDCPEGWEGYRALTEK